MSTILPRLSSDGKQLKTYAKMHKDKNHPYEVKEASFGVTKLAAMAMKQKIRLVFDLEHASLFLTTEEECASGKEPSTKNFTASSIGQEYAHNPSMPLKEGKAYLKPYYILISAKCSQALQSKKINLVQGVKDKGDFQKTVDKCRLIWALCTDQDNLPPLKKAYAKQWADLDDDKKNAMSNYVLLNKSILYPLEKIPYWSQSIEYAKSNGAKEPEEEKN